MEITMLTMLCAGFPLAAFGSSVIDAFWRSTLAGQIIVIIHFLGSILLWSVVITKWRDLAAVQLLTERFMAAYRKEPYPVSLFLKRNRFEGSPAFAAYDGLCRSLSTMIESHGGNPEDLFVGDVGVPKRRLKDGEISSLRNMGEGIAAEQAFRLESGMSTLAIGVTAAPALGLLGTVWGVMQALAVTTPAGGVGMLASVGPGISGALLTTVTGLIVALPSAVVYKVLRDKIRALCVSMDNFRRSLIADVENHYGQQG